MTAITASCDELFSQAKSTARSYLQNAVHEIDKLLGEGYAANNPQLVAAYMQVACADFVGSGTAKVLGEAIEDIAHAVRRVAEAVTES